MSQSLSQSTLKRIEKRLIELSNDRNQQLVQVDKKANETHQNIKNTQQCGTFVKKFAQLLSKYSKTTPTENNLQQQSKNPNPDKHHQYSKQHQQQNQLNQLHQINQSDCLPPVKQNLGSQIEEEDDGIQQKNQKIDGEYLTKIVQLEKNRTKQMQMRGGGASGTGGGLTQIFREVSAGEMMRGSAIGNAINHLHAVNTGNQSANNNTINQKSKSAQITQQKYIPKYYNKDTLPKLAVVNNLLKLSTKLPVMQFLKQVSYKANLMNINPIRLLFFFCVEKMVCLMYGNHGIDKLKKKIGDYQFISKEVCKTLITLLMYIKLNEKSLINRIIQAVFTRFGIRQHFSSSFLRRCIRDNRQLFDRTGIDIQNILNDTQNRKITSGIFRNVEKMQRVCRYQYLKLNLENEEGVDEVIDDPQRYQQNSKLYYFMSEGIKSKQKDMKQNGGGNKISKNGFTKNIKINGGSPVYNYNQIINSQEEWPDGNEQNGDEDRKSVIEEQKYEMTEFVVEIKKIALPDNVKILNNCDNEKQYEIFKIVKGKEVLNNGNDDSGQLIELKRKRKREIPAKDHYSIDTQKQLNTKQHTTKIPPPRTETVSQIPLVTKQKIFEFIQEYMFHNIQDIANRIATVWNINVDELSKLINRHPQNCGSLPPHIPIIKQNMVEHHHLSSKVEEQNRMLKEIVKITEDCSLKGIGKNEIVKELLKILESKGVSNESKRSILEQWKKFRSKLGVVKK